MKKILFIHPALMDYRMPLFGALHKMWNIKFIFTQQGVGQEGVDENHMGIPIEWNHEIIRSDQKYIMYLKLIKELLKKDNEIILTSTSWYICFFLAKITGKKFIYITEYWDFSSSPSFFENFKNSFTKYIANHSDSIIVTGTKSKEAFLKFCRNKNKIFNCIQCSLDYSKMPTQDIRKKLNIEDKKIILYLSRIVERKGLDYLIKAFALLESEIKSVLLIIGNGPFKKDCEKLVEELNIPNVYFLGYSQDKPSYYKYCDVLVLPAIFLENKYEPWGLVINEAMAFGKPIITTDAVGAAFDLVKNDHNGYIVGNKSIDELYKVLFKIFSNPELEHKMGENSRTLFQEYNNYTKMIIAFTNAINYANENN